VERDSLLFVVTHLLIDYPDARVEEVDEQSKKMTEVIDKIKSVSPEMIDSIKMLNSIDISELNKLINNMSKIVDTVSH
jgi:methyl-accepting chemotaxis protein